MYQEYHVNIAPLDEYNFAYYIPRFVSLDVIYLAIRPAYNIKLFITESNPCS